jgi:hypothetical protein
LRIRTWPPSTRLISRPRSWQESRCGRTEAVLAPR